MDLRKYESFFILDPDLSEDGLTQVGDKLKGIVTSKGGHVLSYTPWGKKKLAYPVKKRNYGQYVLMEFASGSELVAELERNMRLDERVLKFITVKLEDQFELKLEESPDSEPRDELPEAESQSAHVEEPVDEPADKHAENGDSTEAKEEE